MTALETTGERQFILFLLFFIPLYLHKNSHTEYEIEFCT